MTKKTSARVSFLIIVIIALTAGFIWSCQKQNTEKENKLIGIINPNKGTQDINKGFIQELHDNGYIEGENTTFLRYDNSFEMDEAIQDMIARNVDLIFTVTTPATRKAKAATKEKNIPVIYAMQDPVASGIQQSLAQNDGNLTGIQIRGSIPKALQWMLEVSPELKHLFVPVKYDTKAAKQSLEDLIKTANALNIKLTVVEVSDQTELDTALATIPAEVDGIFIICSIFIHSNVEKLVQTAIDKKLLIGSGAAQSDRGVTVSYGMIAEKTGRQAARLAGLILQGKNTTDVPSEITDFFICINLQTAQKTNIEIPQDVLQQADIIVR